MAEAFARVGNAYIARLDQNERAIVIDLLAQTLEVVAPEERPSTGDAFADLMSQLDDEGPSAQEMAERDPVLRRLLPDGNRDDPQAAHEFRSATERSLRERKAGNIATAIHALQGDDERISLGYDEAVATMLALADVRLALAERIGIEDEEDSEQLAEQVEALSGPPSDPRLIAAIYYDFLTWLQESLANALMP